MDTVTTANDAGTNDAGMGARGASAVRWFEIMAADLERAVGFYETILGQELRREEMAGTALAVFPCAESGVAGCLMAGTPSPAGTVVYLGCDGRLDVVLARVEHAGGAVLLGRTALPPGMGFFAHIRDSEGNRVGLHSL